MGKLKSPHVKRTQATQGNLVTLQPIAEMFYNSDVMTQPVPGITSRPQIRSEVAKDYEKFGGSQAISNRSAIAEQLFCQGVI